jgi:hypothetical protein
VVVELVVPQDRTSEANAELGTYITTSLIPGFNESGWIVRYEPLAQSRRRATTAPLRRLLACPDSSCASGCTVQLKYTLYVTPPPGAALVSSALQDALDALRARTTSHVCAQTVDDSTVDTHYYLPPPSPIVTDALSIVVANGDPGLPQLVAIVIDIVIVVLFAAIVAARRALRDDGEDDDDDSVQPATARPSGQSRGAAKNAPRARVIPQKQPAAARAATRARPQLERARRANATRAATAATAGAKTAPKVGPKPKAAARAVATPRRRASAPKEIRVSKPSRPRKATRGLATGAVIAKPPATTRGGERRGSRR